MSDFWYVWVLPLVGGLIWWIISSAAVKAPGNALQQKFASLTKDTNGIIAGKKLSEIQAVCGAPNAVSSLGNGQKLCQWQATSYHIALVFDENDVCVGVSSEISV